MNSVENQIFPEYYRTFIQLLNKYHVEYMLIGGYAVGAYGHIRGTNDLDIFINATKENAAKMMQACAAYGIPKRSLKEEMFLVEKMIGIGRPPLRIEIIKKLDVVDFKHAYQRVKTRKLDGVQINIVNLDDLLLLKEAAIKGRNQSRDQEDLNFIKRLVAKIKQ